MDLAEFSSTGLMLMFVLGLRHGLDPDHIACIDGLTWRALSQSHAHAPLIGTLFAIGHGLLVTGIAVVVSRFAPSVAVPATVVEVFGWIPTALLLLVGTLNLRLLTRGTAAHFAPAGWKLRLIPQRLRDSTNPWAVVATGVLFATVFDTTTQAAAWGYVASNQAGGWLAALTAGLAFTLGMVITDTVDGRLVCHVNRAAGGEAAGRRYRRTLGWLIVVISYGVATYNIGKAWVPAIELDELAFTLAGAALMASMVAVWWWAMPRKAHSKYQGMEQAR